MTRPDPDNKRLKRVIMGLSGGVDSAVASLLLQRQGYTVTGLTLVTHDAAEAAVADAVAVCHSLNMAHVVLDIRSYFHEQIIQTFVDDWLAGLTPNPCVLCNPAVKFNILLEQADRLNCAFMATGHYAAVRRHPQSCRLALAMTDSGQKDQTYFLHRLTQDQLSRLIFPLENKQKDEVRHLAAAAGLAGKHQALAAKPDSQDICFIQDADYISLIRQEAARRNLSASQQLLEPGPVVDRQGSEIGRHQGLLAYTIGQRKGIDVKTTERLYVIGKHPGSHTLTVGPYTEVMQDRILVRDVVYSGLAAFNPGQACLARVRSTARPAACHVWPQPDNQLSVQFDDPVAAPAPGQSCVFYADGLVLAGGLIALRD